MITIIRQASIFSPADNPNIWELSSDNVNLVFFRFEIRVVPNTTVMSLDLYPTPANPDKAYVDISAVVKNYVKNQFKGYTSNLIDTFDQTIFSFSVKITERINNSGVIESGSIYLSPVSRYVFNCKLDNLTFKNYTSTNYVVNDLLQIRFCTDKPNPTITNDYANEGLFFLQNAYENTLSVKFDFYNSSGTSIGTYTEAIPSQSTEKHYRINCSINFIKEYLPSTDLTSLSYYTVKLVDSTSAVKSETRTFLYQSLPCHLFPINIVWVNKYGGLDTVQLYQPEATVSTNKSTIRHGQNKYDSTGHINSYDGNAFNVVDEILNCTTEQTIKLNTQHLSDAEQRWLSGILNSKQIYMQIANDLFAPVILSESAYTIQSSIHLTEPITKQFSFKLTDGFTPDVPLLNLNN